MLSRHLNSFEDEATMGILELSLSLYMNKNHMLLSCYETLQVFLHRYLLQIEVFLPKALLME